MEMKNLIDRIYSDSNVLENGIKHTFLQYFRYSLDLAILICKEDNYLVQGTFKKQTSKTT